MEAIYPASGIQINYLEPLKEWRILDLKNLMKKARYERGYVGFTKILSNLEKKKLIGSFIDPFSRRKYLYLTNEGNQYLGGDCNSPAIRQDTLVHDSKMVVLVLELLKLESFYGFELEHIIKGSKEFGTTYKICPDAIMLGDKGGTKFKLAVELELTRKSKNKYLTKIGQYLNSDYYDFVLYFFQSKGVMNSYRKHIVDRFGEDSNKRILYVLNENLLTKKFNFDDSVAYHKNKEGKLDAVF
jgi:hypothetical protein